MRKHVIVLSVALLAPTVVQASPSRRGIVQQGRPPAGMRGTAIAERMAAALGRQSHIEVRGQIEGPGDQTIRYLLRYQATGREYLQETGGMWNHVEVGKQRLGGFRAVSLGRRLYSSTDGRHWLRGTRLVSPSALDTISINPVMSPCCVPGRAAAAQVTNAGLRSSVYGKVYALDYRTTSATASIQGTALIDARSYLPRRYTEVSRSPAMQGAFELRYGGSFQIQTPSP